MDSKKYTVRIRTQISRFSPAKLYTQYYESFVALVKALEAMYLLLSFIP